jgi:hypothetical protein
MSAMDIQRHELRGLDGQNPLGFFAALGLLRVLEEARDPGRDAPPRLFFLNGGRLTPVLESVLDVEAVLQAVVSDAASDRGTVALSLAYGDDGALCDPAAAGAKQDLKPSPASAARHLQVCRNADRRSADLAHAFFSELVQDNGGKTKPTSFHFAAGQQQWLSMVLDLRKTLTLEHVREALLGPAKEHPLPSLAWDSTVARNYALRATDPSGEKRGSIPAANWLGVVGLTYFPVEARGDELETTRVKGGWKTSTFTWPVWRLPAASRAVASLLRGDPTRLTREERETLGVHQVFASRILRSDQGGYGSFAPADVVGPRSAR